MTINVDPVVSMKWVLARLYEPDLMVLDCRFQLGKPDAGRESYEQDHIPHARYVDLERDLSGPLGEHGGRHPLPDPQLLADKLGRLGIDESVRVVAYDNQGGAMAARLWWLLTWLGHSNVYVMQEGYSAWKSAGFPVSSEPAPIAVPKKLTVKLREEMAVSVEAVRKVSAELVNDSADSGAALLIDSREPRRYAGIEEPIDKAAGHIPGAVNFFWQGVLDKQKKWKGASELQEHFAGLDKERELIVYCGSGVTACPNVIGLLQAGFKNVKLYAGSWSDWISYEGNPIVKVDE